jgi:hypothetical protein
MKLALSTMILILASSVIATSVIATSSSSSIRLKTKETLSFRSHSISRMAITSTDTKKTNLETVRAKNEKIILVLQTRNNLITISTYSGDEAPFYSVATETGIPLVDHLTALELKARFPELYDVVTGWASDAAGMDFVPHR